MSLQADQLKELTGIFDNIWEEEQSLAAAQEISREIINEKKTELKAYAEKLELNPKMVLAVYDQYKKAQQGKIEIQAGVDGHVSYEDLTFQVFECLRTTN